MQSEFCVHCFQKSPVVPPVLLLPEPLPELLLLPEPVLELLPVLIVPQDVDLWTHSDRSGLSRLAHLSSAA